TFLPFCGSDFLNSFLSLASLLSFPRLPPRATLFPYTTLFRSMLCGFLISPSESVLAEIPMDSSSSPRTIGLAMVFALLTFGGWRSEEHTSELQSRFDLVCRLLLEKKNINLHAH